MKAFAKWQGVEGQMMLIGVVGISLVTFDNIFYIILIMFKFFLILFFTLFHYDF